jgi:hypothetical protein
MDIAKIISQKEGFKKQFHLTAKQFDSLVFYLRDSDEPKFNTAVAVKLDDMIDYDKDNTVHVTQFFKSALKHARKSNN